MTRALAFVAEIDGQMVGCLFCEQQDDALYVSRLSVYPTHRGLGIAFALMNRAEVEVRQRNLRALTLSVRVTLEYYTRMGFCVVGHGIHEGFTVPTFPKMQKKVPA